MKRPKKYGKFDLDHTMSVYMDYDIDPLLLELMRLKAEQSHSQNDKKPFPTLEEFTSDNDVTDEELEILTQTEQQ